MPINLKQLGILGAAAIMGTVLISGQAKLNFNHHHNLPDVNEVVAPKAFRVDCKEKHCEIYLESTIQEQDKYIGFEDVLDTATSDMDIRIHLRGNGGNVDTTMMLANAIRYSKAKTTMVIDGPVYSAHAVLAFVGKNIEIRLPTVFMFHRPADSKGRMGADICENEVGTDRGQDLKQKCVDVMVTLDHNFMQLFDETGAKFLTKEELFKMQLGYDVFIDGNEMAKRVQQGKAE